MIETKKILALFLFLFIPIILKEDFVKENYIDVLKGNMSGFQMMIETYFLENNKYPKNVKELYKKSENNVNTSSIDNDNSFTKKIQLVRGDSIVENLTLDFNDYDKSKNKNQLINLVLYELYESKNCENSCTNYKIYGTDENGNLITDYK